MSRPRVFVTRRIPEAGLSRVREATDAEVWSEQLPPPRELLLEKAADCDGLLTLLTDPIDAQVIEAAKRLRVISNYAVGFDNIDIPAATARGIPVGHTPGVLTETTAEMAMALMMAIARRVVEGDKYVRAGLWRTWEPQLLLGTDLHRATLGIIGFGRIGQALARRARGFDMRVLYHDIARNEEAEAELGATYADLDDLLRESTFVSLHCALTPETHHLISRREFALMGPDSYLVNTSRGPVIDQQALHDALKSHTIRGAALDVAEAEPLSEDDPLLALDNVIVTPHIASASHATRSKMAEIAAENLLAGLQGRPLPHCANPEAQAGGR